MTKGSLGFRSRRLRRTVFHGWVAVLALLTLTSLALGQTKPKKKGTKPATAPTEEPAPTPPPADTTPPPDPTPPATSAAGAGDATAEGAKSHEEVKADEALGKGSMTDVAEKPGQKYIFIGLRYRGTIIPKFMVNLFVDEGGTFYSNTFGAEIDLRKDDFSLIPALTYVEYSTGDTLFKEKNKPDIPGNYSVINSGLKAIYATADLMWSVKVHKNFDFEYGAGFGLGVIFGDLQTNWVYDSGPAGTLTGSNGHHYTQCPTAGFGGPGSGCNIGDHSGATVAKVGGYTEPSWVNGGSKPNIFPHISIPQIGIRYKPIKQFQARLGIGFSLTGFWFGLSGDYGLEKAEK
jgi:hypothetical protein